MTRQARRPLAVLLVALAMSACGSTVASRTTVTANGGPTDPGLGGGSTSGSSTPGTTPLPTGSAPATGSTGSLPTGTTGGTTGAVPAPGTTTGSTSTTGTTGGVTRTTSPIKIGIVLTATSNAQSYGVSFGNTLDEKTVDDGLIAALNAKGGLNGRRIVPVYAKTDTGSANWETDFSAACATLTQDNHVEAVLGYVFNYFSSFESCLAKKGIPHLNTGYNIPDTKELKAFPLQVALDVPTIGRRALTKLEGAAADGVLTPTSKIGVLRDTCPGTIRSYDDTFAPAARRLGLTVTKTIDIACPNGNSDSGRGVQALQSAELQFASSGIDHVIFHATSEGPALLLFALSAESQSYRPGYVVTSLGNLETVRQYAPAAQLKNVHAYGWMPTQDVPPSTYPAQTDTQKRCLSLLRSRSITPTAGVDYYYYVYNICEAFFVYELALAKTSGDSNGRAVIAAVKGLGTSFSSATNLGGSAFSPSLPDAPRSVRHLVYVAASNCFRYIGPARAISPS